ncbi:unnamed protein product, partial [Mesorhabditis spiculigera]
MAAFLNAFSGKVRPGDVYSLNLTADGTTTPYKYLILAVEPNPGHIAKCYEALMDKLEALHIDSVTVTGLGCGAMNVSADDSAKHLSNAIQARIDTGRLAKLKNLIVCDMIEHIVKKFAQAFSNDSESTSTDDTDNADFTYDVDPSKLTDDPCPICLMELNTEGLTVVALKICHHMFHKECFTQLVNNSGPKRCPNCTLFFSFPKGDMPSNATMSCNLHRDKKVKLEGGVGYYEIVYDVPSGIQGPMHLRPGLPYRGTTRYAYLPNTEAGAKVLKLLKKAFECRLTFTIGKSDCIKTVNRLYSELFLFINSFDRGNITENVNRLKQIEQACEQLKETIRQIPGIDSEEDEQTTKIRSLYKQEPGDKLNQKVHCSYCNSIVLLQNLAFWDPVSFELPMAQQRKDRQEQEVDKETLEGFWAVKNMMDFENVGFTHAVGGYKYLTCAECEYGPIGFVCRRVKKDGS